MFVSTESYTESINFQEAISYINMFVSTAIESISYRIHHFSKICLLVQNPSAILLLSY